MNLKEKIERLKQLNNIVVPSDQEIEERQQLTEEIELILNESNEARTQNNQYVSGREPSLKPHYNESIKDTHEPEKKIESQKRKRTIYEILKDKLGEKNATWDEIQQLKLNAYRARLKADIAKSKTKVREMKQKRLNAVLGMVTGKGSEEPKKKRKSERDDTDDFKDLMGTNDSKRFKGLI